MINGACSVGTSTGVWRWWMSIAPATSAGRRVTPAIFADDVGGDTGVGDANRVASR